MVECKSCKRVLKENENLKRRIEVLEKLLNIYDNPHTPPSQKRTSNDTSREDGQEKPKGIPGRKEGHIGTTRPYREPDETITATVDECPYCKNCLGKPTSYERRLIEDIPEPQPVKVTELLLAHHVCTNCGKEVVASHPDCPKEGRFGKNVTTVSTVLKHKGRLSYRNVSDMLRIQHGMEITPASVMEMTRRAADALRPEYDAIKRRIPEADVINADETGAPVNGMNCWNWVFVAGKDVLFRMHGSRGKTVPEEVLEGFNGVLGIDGWRSYSGIPCEKQRCWAHILREADKLAETEKEAVGLSKALHILFELTKRKVSKDPPPYERLAIHSEALDWLDKWLDIGYESEKVNKLVEKIRNARDHWFTFVLHPGVEPTNNAAEQPLREFVVQRKIFGTLRNEKGMYRYETIMSVFETWKRYGIDIFDELKKRL
jgi:transposase